MKEIYLVRRNSDMTEGRGPMVVTFVYLDLVKAKAFVEKRSGVMGACVGDPSKWKFTAPRAITDGYDYYGEKEYPGYWACGNDWDIEVRPVVE